MVVGDWLGMKSLNTHPWNLGTVSFAGVVASAAAACGPAIDIDGDGDTEGGSTTQSSDTIIEPTASTTTPPEGCEANDDCAPGFYCSDGACIEEYDCYDYGCCIYGHCSPPPYYDCYEDDDCGTGALCTSGYCDAVQSLPDCGGPVELAGAPISHAAARRADVARLRRFRSADARRSAGRG